MHIEKKEIKDDYLFQDEVKDLEEINNQCKLGNSKLSYSIVQVPLMKHSTSDPPGLHSSKFVGVGTRIEMEKDSSYDFSDFTAV